MDLSCPLQAAADEAPSAPALSAPGLQMDFAELNQRVSGTARRISALGVSRGDRVALRLENTWQTVLVLLAAIRAGAVVCPLSTRLPDAVANARARALGADLVIGALPSRGAVEPDRLLDTGASRTAPIPADRPATIIFTSGSTGTARAALHTFGNHYFSAAGSNRNIPLAPGDRWLLSLPLYHVGGIAILFRCMLGRAAIVLPHPEAPMWESDASHVSMVSTQLRRSLRDDGRKILPKKAILLGGSAMPPDLLDRAVELGLPVHTSYGLTEMASQVATTPPGAGRDELRTCGGVLPHREVRIDANNQILVRGPTRFEGYVDGERPERPFDEEGWFATGDLGRFDERNRITVLGRIDHMFVSGGENILPEEIEAVIGAVDAVERVVVVPVPDKEYGRRPVAFVQTATGDLDEPRLRAAIEARLPRFMVPDAFYPWPADAAEDRMKIDRQWLRRRAETLHGAC